MNFKIKCLVQSVFSSVPFGHKLNYLFQKHVTKSFPLKNNKFLFKVNNGHKHFINFKEFNSLKKPSMRYYEFGAGWDFLVPLMMSNFGFKVFLIDLRRLTSLDLVKKSIKQFIHLKDKIPFDFKISDSRLITFEDIENENIFYSAPSDARKTNYPSNHFSFSSSTAVFEHLPEEDILSILKETYRVLESGGILSMIIDYQDHWSYFDSNLSVYSFLEYDDEDWKKYNPSLHFQNRLRHSDYMNIIKKTDFKICMEHPVLPSDEELLELKKVNLADKYKYYDIHDLAIKGSEIVLMK